MQILVRTKFNWSWAGGPLLIVRTVYLRIVQNFEKGIGQFWHQLFNATGKI
jgi:hypothetical protein